MTHAAVIFGFEGPVLTQSERDFFRDIRPWGFIVFRRNIDSPAQLRQLTDELRALDGRDNLPILIDQEGGPVARLGPPHWCDTIAAARFGGLYQCDRDAALKAVYLNSQLMAAELFIAGINVNCLPVLDLPAPGSAPFLDERAYGTAPQTVTECGRAAADGLLAGGVLPVIKHMPGHGRGNVDSHDALPRITCTADELIRRDFAPFAALSDLPLGMTAHIVVEAYDPEHAATVSKIVIHEVIRKHMAFEGALMTDDLSMNALEGDSAARTSASYRAGCDLILHCNGRRSEMEKVAAAARTLAGRALQRADRALSKLRQPRTLDLTAARSRLSDLMNVPQASSLYAG